MSRIDASPKRAVVQKSKTLPPAPSVRQTLAEAIALHQQGELSEAESKYRAILQVDDNHFDALHMLGVVRYQQGDHPEAVEIIGRALEQNPESAVAHYNLGLALRDLKRFEAAMASYQRALEIWPDYADAHNGMGNALRDLGRLEEAVTSFRRAVGIRPDFAEGHHNLAVALGDLRRSREAMASYRRALEIRPDYAESHHGLGNMLRDLNQPTKAIASYQRALKIRPDYTGVHYSLGKALSGDNHREEAIAAYRRVLSIDPNHHRARLALCMAQLPTIYDEEAEIETHRSAYESSLRKLHAFYYAQPPGCLATAAEVVGSHRPFFLAYQCRDDRALQALYGDLLCRIMAAAYPRWSVRPAMPSPQNDGRIRVGFISGFFRFHPVWRIIVKGWAQQLDRRRFRLFGYHTQATVDEVTKQATGAFEEFSQGPRTLSQWAEAIRGDNLHVLIYPEIGMDPMTVRLATLRLAPVQCMAWGHPTTCGFPTIDYYLSSDLMEPANAQEHYTETLVLLPNLGSYHSLFNPKLELTREEVGARKGSVLYWCCQSLFKYLPQYDEVFPRIAQAVGDCQFVFFRDKSDVVTEKFQARLQRAFGNYGLSYDRYCVISPRLRTDRFLTAMRLADVFLDTFGFSGGTTTMDVLAAGVPIVTCRGELMRGRQTAAILEMMGVTETIADTIDEYVDLAVRMGRDADWRADIAQRIATNRHKAYRDRMSIEGLEVFLARVSAPNGVLHETAARKQPNNHL